MSLRQATNECKIEGKVSSLEVTYAPEGTPDKDLYVSVIMRVQIDEEAERVIPVRGYAKKYTNAGTPSKVYPEMMKLESTIKTMTDVSPADATKIRINGNLAENSYYDRDGNMRYMFNVRSNFFSVVTGNYNPKATFTVEGSILDMIPIDGENGVDNLTLVMGVPDFRGNVNVIKINVPGANRVQNVCEFFQKGQTTTVRGEVDIRQITTVEMIPQAIGEDVREEKTVYINELTFTSASEPYAEGDTRIYSAQDINEGMAAREKDLRDAEQKRKDKEAQTQAQAPENEKRW